MKHIIYYTFFILVAVGSIYAQREPDEVYMSNINGVKLFVRGNQGAYPIINLGEFSMLELHFDDFDAGIKNYYYTFQLCDADWTPSYLHSLDYIQGFTQNRIAQYRISSIATTKYTHYEALLPERNCLPKISGNYLLKVFLNGDTSQLVFSKRVLIAGTGAKIFGHIQQPFNSEYFLTHQKLQFSVDKGKLNILNNDQQLKVVVLQNYRWDNATQGKRPVFMRGNVYEYNGEMDYVFPGGKEYRWVDLRSYRFQSDRIDRVNLNTQPVEVWLKNDMNRVQAYYLYYRDMNGFFSIETTEDVNPWWQGDYANVHFTFVPDKLKPLTGKDVYVIGQMTDYKLNDNTKMEYNDETRVYEKTLLLKQGYYTYTYAVRNSNSNEVASAAVADGNYWETDNDYTVLVYYRPITGRSDELIGVQTFNSKLHRDR